MKAVVFNTLGGPEVLEIEEQEPKQPEADEVLVRVTSAGLNRADCLFRQGQYLQSPELPSRIGMEAAGVVEAVGPEAKMFKPGDRVGTLPGIMDLQTQGGVAESVIVAERMLLPTPGSVDDADAGGVWMQYLTAWGALNFGVRVAPEQYVVITAASSSVGLAAVQLVRGLGAIPIATTTSSHKIDRIKENGAEHVIDIKNEIYTESIQEITDGKGVHVVFDAVSGESVAGHMKVCRPGATIFIYGSLDPSPPAVHTGMLIGKNLDLRGYTVFALLMNAGALAEAAKGVTEGLDSEALNLIIDRRFPMAEAEEAHRYMESNQQFGKIVINP